MMYCPECGCEFVEGVTHCSDCGVPLTDAPPEPEPPPPDLDLVVLLRTHSPADIAILRSVLDNESIRYLVQGEEMTHVHAFYEPAWVWVAQEDFDRAVRCVQDLELNRTVFGHVSNPRSEEEE